MDREFSLDELLADPLTRQLMARDQVDEIHVRTLARRVRRRLEAGDRAPRPPEPRSFDGW